MPSAPSAGVKGCIIGKCTWNSDGDAISSQSVYGGGSFSKSGYYTKFNFPSGGTWRYWSNRGYIGEIAGGSNAIVAGNQDMVLIAICV